MAALERHRGLAGSVNIPLFTDGLSPDSIRAALVVGVDRLESEAERRKHALDWATFTVEMRAHTVEENTTMMTVSARRIL